MTLKDWKNIAKQLPESYPSWQLSSHIRDAVYKMEKIEVENIYDND